MKKFSTYGIFILVLTLSFNTNAKTSSSDEVKKQKLWDSNIEISKACRYDVKNNAPIDENELFVGEVPAEKLKIECMKEHIKKYTLEKYSASHWDNINQQLNDIEKNYISLYRTVRCPTWPDCPQSGNVIPYMDYYYFLERLFYDMRVSTEI